MYNILYSFMLTLSKLNKKINQLFLIDLIYNLYLEATPGFEPGIRVLQTRALPLGYVAEYWAMSPNRHYSIIIKFICQYWICILTTKFNGKFLHWYFMHQTEKWHLCFWFLIKPRTLKDAILWRFGILGLSYFS